MDVALIIGTLIMFVVLVLMLVKGLNPQFSLILVGMVAIMIMMFVTGQSILEQSTGNFFFDAFSYLQTSLVSSFTSTGITLIAVLGYVEYMNMLKASDVFALSVAKHVVKIKSKYAILVLALLIACVIKWVIPSAVTSFLMMFATIYPVLRRCGINRITAIMAITVTLSWSMGPGQPFTSQIYGTFAPDSGMTAPDYFLNYELKYFIPVFVVSVVAFLLTVKFFDARDAKKPVAFLTPDEVGDDEDIDTSKLGIPKWYGLLPIIPLVLVILLGGQVIPGVRVGVVPIYIMCGIFVVIIEMIRRKSVVDASRDFMKFLEGMGTSFGRYATVVWAGIVFADGVTQVGGLDILISMVVSADTSAMLFLFVISIVIILCAILTSQVVLCIYGVGPIIASFCALTGADPVYMLLPMGVCATAPGLLSPAAAITLVAAEKAGLPVMSYIVRMAIPILAATLATVLCCMFMFA